jgi:copper chaperone CopZ
MSNEVRLSIPGMKCNGCVTAIEKALNLDIGVTTAKVDLDSKTAVVESDSDLSVLLGALKAAGFDAQEIAAEDGN